MKTISNCQSANRYAMYRILCLSGGGLRGIFQAEFLRRLEESFGKFWESFDLIVGTSTGSLIAAGLHVGVAPEKICQYYHKIGPLVFPRRLSWNFERSFDAIQAVINHKTSGPVYRHTADRFKKLLEHIYLDRTVGDGVSATELAVTATDVVNGRVRVFSGLTGAEDLSHKIVDIVMASTSVPGLFPCYEIEDKIPGEDGFRRETRSFIDGGMWAHSPVLPAIVLAHANRGIPFEDMKVLSIGTGNRYSGIEVDKYHRFKNNNSDFRLNLLYTAMSAASDAGERAGSYLLGEQNYLHVDPDIDICGGISLFDYEQAFELLPIQAKIQANHEPVCQFLSELVSVSC